MLFQTCVCTVSCLRLHGPDSATMFQSLMDKTLHSSSDKIDADVEAFGRLTVSEAGSEEVFSRRQVFTFYMSPTIF